jgi:acetyltransferase-like isoleucine patch superfamily enzyme
VVRRLLSFFKGIVFGFLQYETDFMRLQRLIKERRVIIGKHTYGWQSMAVDVYEGCEMVKVHIGKYCSIGPNVRIITSGIHPTDWVSTFPFRSRFNLPGKFKDGMPSTKGDIIIGNDVWIGTEVMILSGVKIGDGAVIASRALITKDVPPYSVYGGNPANLIKYRFSTSEIEYLNQLKWWDWDSDKVLSNVHHLSSSNIEKFIQQNPL